MVEFAKLLHLVAATIWLGGMTFMLWALRPVAIAQLAPSQRLPLLAAVLARFFQAVWLCIAVLLSTGAGLLSQAGLRMPAGWQAMAVLGLAMVAIFGHLYFGPFRRLRQAAQASDWPTAAVQLARMHRLVLSNFALGWLALAAVRLLK